MVILNSLVSKEAFTECLGAQGIELKLWAERSQIHCAMIPLAPSWVEIFEVKKENLRYTAVSWADVIYCATWTSSTKFQKPHTHDPFAFCSV